MDSLFKKETIIDNQENKLGVITEQDRLYAAKQILCGLAVLFALTMLAYLVSPQQGVILLEICKTVFPPLATLIIAFYFQNKNS